MKSKTKRSSPGKRWSSRCRASAWRERDLAVLAAVDLFQCKIDKKGSDVLFFLIESFQCRFLSMPVVAVPGSRTLAATLQLRTSTALFHWILSDESWNEKRQLSPFIYRCALFPSLSHSLAFFFLPHARTGTEAADAHAVCPSCGT